MSDMQQYEIEKLHKQIIHDVNHLVEKYQKIMAWDVPENDDATATQLILKEIKAAIDKIE